MDLVQNGVLFRSGQAFKYLLPNLPSVDFLKEATDGLFAVFGIGQRLHKPEFAMLHELGVITAARDPSVIRMDMA